MDIADKLESTHARHTSAQLIAVSLVLASVIFVVDLSLPLGVAGGVLYVAVVLLSLWSQDWRYTIMTALVVTALTIVGYFSSPSGGVLWVVLLNRLFALFAIWITSAVILRYRKTEQIQPRLAGDLTVITEIQRIISSSLDIDIVFDRFTEEVGRLISFDRLSLTTLDEVGTKCAVARATGTRVTGLEVQANIPVNGTAVQQAIKTKEGILFQGDSDLTAAIGPSGASILEAGFRSFIVVPLVSNDRAIATLNFGTTRTNAYTQRHLKLAKYVADQFASAVANSHLYEKSVAIAEQLIISEATYRGMYEDAPVAYFSVGIDGRIRNVNRSGELLTGYALHDLIDRPIIDLYADTPSGKGKAKRLFHQFQAGEEIQGEDLEMLKADGSSVWVSLAVHPVRNAQGRIIESLSVAIDITERVLAEESMRESEERFRSVFNESAGAMVLTDRNGQYIQTNPAMSNMLGYSREELLSMTVKDVTFPGDFDHNSDKMRQLWAGEIDSVAIDKRYVHKDGHVVWGSLVVSTICEADGNVMHILAQIQDVTERIRVEEQLRLQAAALESAANAIAILDDQRNIIWLNPAFSDMSGYTEEEVLGQNISMLRSDELDPVIYQDIKDTIYSGRVWRGEVANMRKDGSISAQETTITPVKDPDGKITNFISIKQDVTERKQAEEQLKLQAAALDSAANAIVITDQQGIISWVNGAFTSLTGYTAEEAIGQHTRILKSSEQDLAFYQDLWSTVTSGQVWHGEVINRRKDASLYTEEMTITPIRNADGEVTNFIAIKQDVTERKQLEARLLHAQKMESIGTLAGGVAHDFNNALTGIIGFSQFGVTISSDDRVRGFFQEIGKAGERAAGLTRQLLAFSRQEIVQPRVLNLNDSIMEIDKMLRRLIGEDIEMVTLPAAELGLVKADPGQIEQVLINMAINSRDAMPAGGTLTIKTSDVTVGAEFLRQQPETAIGEYVMFSVRDTGAGMPDDVKARVFEPFFTTKETGKGTGLGLSTCYGVVAQSGGFINVHSSPGQGTTFEVYLPRVEESACPSTVLTTDEPLPLGVETVLLVEDEPLVREVAATILRGQGYSVLQASDGTNALEIMEKAGKDIDLLLTDMIMPLMGGRQLAEQLWRQHPELKVIFTSGYTDDTVLRQGALEKDAEFLQKPYTFATMAHKVREVLDK